MLRWGWWSPGASGITLSAGLFLVIGICLFLSTIGADYAVLAYRLGHRLPFGPAALILNEI